jgi:hypothetical protein
MPPAIGIMQLWMGLAAVYGSLIKLVDDHEDLGR